MRFRKFTKSIGLLTLVASCSITTFAVTIKDVKENHWAYTSIIDLTNKGIMVPTSAGEFKPNQTMTYFEMADVIAKATGYVDVDIHGKADANFKAQIQANYEKQKPILAAYAAKYSKWNKLYDKQIAYLLGRGYIKTSDLDKFIVKSGSTESHAIITKEQLSILMVRVLAKEETAIKYYKEEGKTGFKDENSISPEARPHMAYLRSIGLISGDTSNCANPKSKVNKAVCAKLVSTTLKHKLSEQGQTPSESIRTKEAVIKKIMTKDKNSYYVSLNIDGNQSYYTMRDTAELTDDKGKVLKVSELNIEDKVKVTLELKDKTEYITSLQVLTSKDKEDESTPPTTDKIEEEKEEVATLSGELIGNALNGFIRLNNNGNTQAYILSNTCKVLINGEEATAKELLEGDQLKITVSNSTVTEIQATQEVQNLTIEGKLLSKKQGKEEYTLTLESKGKKEDITLPYTTKIKRNGKLMSISDMRIGDTFKASKEEGVLTGIEVTSIKQTVTGKIKEIHLAKEKSIVLQTQKGDTTYIIGADAELYDDNTKEYIGVRDLHLGQEIACIVDSSEVVSLDVKIGDSSVKAMGTVKSISRNNDYIEVLLDYDPMTEQSKVYKRIQVTEEVKVIVEDRVRGISSLEEGMQVIIVYKYLDDRVPQRIQTI